MDTWQTDRIRLRAFRADDWTHCARWNEEPDWSYADTFAYPPQAPDRVRAWAEAEAAKARSEDMRLIIEDRKSGQPVGTIDTNHCNAQAGTFRYGIAVEAAARRQGFASHAILLLLRYYFEERRFQKANTSVWSFNAPSTRLHEGLGFTTEGRARRAVFRGGAYHDEILFGMTVEEFRQLPPAKLLG